MSFLPTAPQVERGAQTKIQSTHLHLGTPETGEKDVSEERNEASSVVDVNIISKIDDISQELPAQKGTTSAQDENEAGDDVDPEIENQHTTPIQNSEDKLEDNSTIQVNIKDFAYSVSDPRHFGIYPSDDDDDDDEEEDEEEEEEEEGDIYDSNDTQTDDYNEFSLRYNQKEIHHPRDRETPTTDSRLYADVSSNVHTESDDVGRDHPEFAGQENDNVAIEAGADDFMYSNEDENNDILHAVALYEFTPENSNELPLIPDQLLIINYECGDGWLVAHDPSTGQTGLVPSEYIRILEIDPNEEDYDAEAYSEFAEDAKDAQRFMPEILADDANRGYSANQGIADDINKLSI